MTNKKVLITGSNGTIGKILMEGLDGFFKLYGVDIIIGKSNTRTYIADVSDYKQIADVLKKVKPSCIVHLAADSRPDADWDSVLRNNIIGTRNVYEAARKHCVNKVVFTSSNHATGAYERSLSIVGSKMIKVIDPVKPDSDYGTSKVFGEAVARQYYEVHKIQSIVLRIGSVLADDNPRYDSRHLRTWLSHKDLIQLVIKSISSSVRFGIYYGVSNNKERFWDISNALDEIGFEPVDDASRCR